MINPGVIWRTICSVFPLFTIPLNSISQDTDRAKISVNLEIRPRAEYRSNYSSIINDPDQTEFYVSQRNRLNIDYKKKNILLHSSFQEIHLWGKNGLFSSIGGINAYELYIQKKFSNSLSLKAGRQGVLLDNGRIFSDAPWAQQGRSHEGLRLTFNKSNIKTDFFALGTRKYNPLFGKNISPVAEHKYKWLFVHHLNIRANDFLTLTTINSFDIFQNQKNYSRYTSGGRIEFEKNSDYVTLSAYYQYGRTSEQKKLSAYYFQPEIRLSYQPIVLRLGAEILSGTKQAASDKSQNFDVLYGVAWKFMGNMNFFTKFPNDVNGKGLVNPYLFSIFSISKKVSIRSDYHLFYAQFPLVLQNGISQKRYLGFENDFSIKITPNKNMEINYGLSYFIAQKEMLAFGKMKDTNKTPIWSYLMISYLFK